MWKCVRAQKGRGGGPDAPSWTEDALHKPLDKHRGAKDGGRTFGCRSGCMAEAEPLEKGVEVGAR